MTPKYCDLPIGQEEYFDTFLTKFNSTQYTFVEAFTNKVPDKYVLYLCSITKLGRGRYELQTYLSDIKVTKEFSIEDVYYAGESTSLAVDDYIGPPHYFVGFFSGFLDSFFNRGGE